jgi:hypothetical protein
MSGTAQIKMREMLKNMSAKVNGRNSATRKSVPGPADRKLWITLRALMLPSWLLSNWLSCFTRNWLTRFPDATVLLQSNFDAVRFRSSSASFSTSSFSASLRAAKLAGLVQCSASRLSGSPANARQGANAAQCVNNSGKTTQERNIREPGLFPGGFMGERNNQPVMWRTRRDVSCLQKRH